MRTDKTLLVAAFLATMTAVAPVTAEQCWDGQRAYRCNVQLSVAPKGQAPVHWVVNCLTGSEATGYMPVACNDPRAHRVDPATGRTLVCFVDEQNVVAFDAFEAVSVGAEFKRLLLRAPQQNGYPWVPLWLGTYR